MRSFCPEKELEQLTQALGPEEARVNNYYVREATVLVSMRGLA